jgi:hypothetical protein
MTILSINDLALQLVANDFSKGRTPSNGGPTKTSRALAIIHLAAHDAYAKVTGQLTPQLTTLPDVPAGIGSNDATGTVALLGAGIHAAELLYPDDAQLINIKAAKFNTNQVAFLYGRQVAQAWFKARANDGSNLPQLDRVYSQEPGHHRPDPLNPKQETLGRNWGQVTPFVLTSVKADAPLEAPPALNSKEYAKAFDQVLKDGKNDIILRDPDKAVVGLFWAYDGANKLGTPPRLYNQVVRKIQDFDKLSHIQQIKILTAINVAMADAGIAAWHWKYEYDVWRPVVGIREAEKGWGPTGKGDGNTFSQKGDPFWLPLGAPKSNPFPEPKFGAAGSNGTPNFPAYPSGHATFGAACFETVAGLLNKKTEDITVVDFTSDEFNGVTTDNTGTVRPKLTTTFNLQEAINDNNISRIYLGVHWIFDATGGEKVGKAVADKVIAAFP